MDNRKTILICDDEPALRELIRASLDESYLFAEASDGLTALELAREVEPDLVVGDLQAEGDGIPQDDDAGTIPSLRQGQLASSIPG